MSRSLLARQALQASIKIRMQNGFGLENSINVYELCRRLGVRVYFVGDSLEGMYSRGSIPRIFISSLRPIARRAFNCAHELGHHLFGHGSSIDQLQEQSSGKRKPNEEFLVDVFAGHLLMPVLGVRHAFARRGWTSQTASPEQVFSIASGFGVGYSTLINHLLFGLRDVTTARAKELHRVPVSSIKKNLIGEDLGKHCLVVADEHQEFSEIECEVGSRIVLPPNSLVAGDILVFSSHSSIGPVYIANRVGLTYAKCKLNWSAKVNVMPLAYKGFAKFRTLEQCDD